MLKRKKFFIHFSLILFDFVVVVLDDDEVGGVNILF